MFKILNGLIFINKDIHFQKSEFYRNYNLRRHNMCLQNYEIPNTNIRQKFFSIRITNLWNKLPKDLVESNSLGLFKSKLENVDFTNYYTLTID